MKIFIVLKETKLKILSVKKLKNTVQLFYQSLNQHPSKIEMAKRYTINLLQCTKIQTKNENENATKISLW